MRAFGLLFGLTLIVSGCSTYYSPEEVTTVATRGIAKSHAYLKDGRKVEAQIFARAVAKVDPKFDGLDALGRELDLSKDRNRSALGFNRAMYRLPIQRGILAKTLLYIPDRILDLLDIVTFDVNVGPGVYVDAHVTRFIQVGAGGRISFGLGLHEMRSLGFQGRSDAAFNLLPFGAQGTFLGRAGTSGFFYASESLAGVHGPKDDLYQNAADYYAIGAAATAGIVGAEVDFHPLQLIDFLGGIFLLDFLHDDFANSTGLSFGYADKELMKTLTEIAASKKSLADYRAAYVEDKTAKQQ